MNKPKRLYSVFRSAFEEDINAEISNTVRGEVSIIRSSLQSELDKQFAEKTAELQSTFDNQLNTEVRKALLTISENDNTFYIGASYGANTWRDRYDYDRLDILREALLQWRTQPLARRIVDLTNQFTLGASVNVQIEDEHTRKFVNDEWNHRLNLLAIQLPEWTTELTITGNLFLIVTVDHGFSFLRPCPTENVSEIKTLENDIRTETAYIVGEGADAREYPAYNPADPAPVFMLHYSINRPAGGQWGESDLAPILKWLSRYSYWLEDRVRLNRFRTTFNYIVQGRYASPAEKALRQQEIQANPPAPGSILVTDESEAWGILSANLDAFDASVDGLTIKKMIAAGAGIPLHYLAEPESATSTTATAAGTPTFKKFEARQEYIKWMLADIIKIMCEVRALVDSAIQTDPETKITCADVSERDNAALALASTQIISNFGDLFDRELIDSSEYMRMVYKFAGEELPAKIPEGIRKPVTSRAGTQEPANPDLKTNYETGETSAPKAAQ